MHPLLSVALVMLAANAPAIEPSQTAQDSGAGEGTAAVASVADSAGSSSGGTWVGLAVGPAFPFNRGPVWLRTQVRAGFPLLRLDERLDVSLVLPLSVGVAQESGAFSSHSSVVGFDLLPSARLGVRGPGALGFYGDFGVGITHFRYTFTLPSLGEGKGDSTGFGLRLAGGLSYTVASQWLLFFEPLHLLFHTAQEAVFRFGNTHFTSSTGAGPQASVLLGGAFTW